QRTRTIGPRTRSRLFPPLFCDGARCPCSQIVSMCSHSCKGTRLFHGHIGGTGCGAATCLAFLALASRQRLSLRLSYQRPVAPNPRFNAPVQRTWVATLKQRLEISDLARPVTSNNHRQTATTSGQYSDSMSRIAYGPKHFRRPSEM